MHNYVKNMHKRDNKLWQNHVSPSGSRSRSGSAPPGSVALTGPWGHDGAYATLEAVVRHHLDPVVALDAYEPSQMVLPHRSDLDAVDLVVHNDPLRREAIAGANELAPADLSDRDVANLVEFLRSLTDPASLDLRADVPERVPSGLPVRD